MDRFKLFTFNSTHQAILMEKILKANGHEMRLIPMPRNLSASCGLAARVLESDLEAINRLVSEHGIEVSGVHDF